jgi:hypothetical protein
MARFESEMEEVMNDPVYKGRFSTDIVYVRGEKDE